MSTTLAGKRIAFLVAPEGAEQVELTEPWKAVQEAGGTPELVSTEVGKIQAFNHLTPADTFEADKAADSVTASEYDGLVLPGGVANPDFLRGNASAVRFTRSFFDSGRPVAAICHAAWTMIDADVVRGRMITSWPTLRTDLHQRGRQLGRRGSGGVLARAQHTGVQPQARRSARLLQHPGGGLRRRTLRPL